jgi:ABC-type nitrate/sulfonate/bicarbonate transport system permease component
MERWLPAIVILGGLVLWEIGARSGWIARVFFPPPTIIVLTLVKMVRWSDRCASYQRLFILGDHARLDG